MYRAFLVQRVIGYGCAQTHINKLRAFSQKQKPAPGYLWWSKQCGRVKPISSSAISLRGNGHRMRAMRTVTLRTRTHRFSSEKKKQLFGERLIGGIGTCWKESLTQILVVVDSLILLRIIRTGLTLPNGPVLLY